MKQKQTIIVVLGLLLMVSGMAALRYERTHQKLGAPAVKTRPMADGQRVEVVLPETVLDYTSKALEVDPIVTNTLPGDTSFGQRVYESADGFGLLLNVVLMGADRTSLHKPQFCLQGQGWRIDQSACTTEAVQMERPMRYQLPVTKLIVDKTANMNGQPTQMRGVYVYYYVADGALSASPTGFQRMWLLTKEYFRTGVFQRWAYVTYFAVCPPGKEDATFERMKNFIAASAPEFQLTPKPLASTLSAAK